MMIMSQAPAPGIVPRRLSDGLSVADGPPMAGLIECVARSYAASRFVESTANNKDAWIDELWSCYHPHGNYGSYCTVGAYVIVRTAFDLAARSGTACLHGFPVRPLPGSSNRERTLYGNVYRTLMEIERAGVVPTGREPEVGAMFCRASNDSGHNHAGIVIETPLTNGHYITTVEANTTVSGGSSDRKGFVTVRYSKAAYDRYTNRPFTKSADAARNYGSTAMTGWRFVYFHRVCSLTSIPAIPPGYRACLGVEIVCEAARLPVPTPPRCDVTAPPPADDSDEYGEWQLFSNIYPRALPGGSAETGPKEGDAQVSPDGCWLRYRRGVTLLPPDAAPPMDAPPCQETFLLKSACDPDDGQGARTVVRFATANGVVTLSDLKDYGVCEAMMSSVITRNDHMGRGYSQRAKAVYDYVPMIRMDNCNVFVLAESSEMFRIFEQFSLWGPNPRIVSIDRTRFSDGTGGGWAERLGRWLHPEGPKIFLPESSLDGILGRQDSYYVSYALRGSGIYQKRLDARDPFYSYKPGDIMESGFELRLFDLLIEWDKRAADRGKQNLVLVWRGSPITVWDAVRGPLRVISGLIPGVGPIVSVVSTTIDTIRAAEGTALDVAFTLTSGIASALGTGVLGEKPFGVEASVFRDIQSATQRAGAVYRTLQASRGQSGIQAALAVAREFGRQFPDVTSALQREFADEERWIRNAASEVDRWWNGALGDVRSTVHGIADGWSTQAMGSLIALQQGVESTFAYLVADVTSIAKSATQIPYVQELLLTKPDASLLGLIPGVNKIAGNILKVESIYRQDVTDAVVHSALAGLATGKQVIDGALDSLVLSSLLNKASDFAARGWDFSLPITMPKDKAECFAHEVRVVTGLECCAPKRYVCGMCLDPTSLQPCPPGQYRDSDGCCVERPVLDMSTGSGGSVDIGGSGSVGGSGGISPTTNVGTSPRDVGTVSTPDVLPSCIRVVGTTYRYCPPPYCGVRTGAAPTPEPMRREQATVQMTNSNGGAFELRATRDVGTEAWTQYEVRAMQPFGNSWVPSATVFEPAQAGSIVPGMVMTAEMFEALRRGQGATPVATTGLSGLRLSGLGAMTPGSGPVTGNLPGTMSAFTTVPTDAVLPTCTVMYEARYSSVPYPQWHAKIGARWMEIVDCCPRAGDGCCDETSRELRELRKIVEATSAETRRTQTMVSAMSVQQRSLATDVGTILEGVLRSSAGEPVDLSGIRADLAFIRSQLPLQPTKYDDSVLLTRIGELETAIRGIRLPATYDDAAVRRDIADLKRIVEARCQCESRAYDARFDTIEAMIRAIVVPPPVLVQPEANEPVQPASDYRQAIDYRPYFESVQRTLAEIRAATGRTYDDKFAELAALIDRLPKVCPACPQIDLAEIRAMLVRIEQNTLRNYDSEFAAIRQLIAAMDRDGVRGYDRRFDELEQRIAAIRIGESYDYTDRFNRIDETLESLRKALPKAPVYDAYFQAIIGRLNALDMRPQAPGQDGTPTAQNCDYRWDEVLRLLRDVKVQGQRGDTEPEDGPAFQAYLPMLREMIDQATTRISAAEDGRYDDIRALILGLRSEIGTRPDCPVAASDPRLVDIMRLLMELQATSGTMTTSIERMVRENVLLRENMQRLDTAFARHIDELKEAVRTTGGTTDLVRAIEGAQTEWRYQQGRYEEELRVLERRMNEIRTSVSALPQLPTVPDQPSRPLHPGQPPERTPRRESRERERRTEMPRMPERECEDCPTLVERHERYVYGPLPASGPTNEGDDCDSC